MPIRAMHWIGAVAIVCMILSGWQIYDASPSFPVIVPAWMTLGGWLAGAIAWHLSAMWVLFADGLAYLAYGVATGHFRRDIAPTGPAALARDTWAALHFRLDHRLGHYNAVQRWMYSAVLLAILLAVATGLSIWKPVQLGWLVVLFGGYTDARFIHLMAMIAIVLFLLIHVPLALAYPKTIASMLAGTAAEDAP